MQYTNALSRQNMNPQSASLRKLGRYITIDDNAHFLIHKTVQIGLKIGGRSSRRPCPEHEQDYGLIRPSDDGAPLRTNSWDTLTSS